MARREIFSQSNELREVLYQKGWELYDPRGLVKTKGKIDSYDLQKRGSSRTYEIGGNYIMIPRPFQGMTLKETVKKVKSYFYAGLSVKNPYDEKWDLTNITNNRDNPPGTPIMDFVFSRLCFYQNKVYTQGSFDSTGFRPTVGIRAQEVVETFKNDFKTGNKHIVDFDFIMELVGVFDVDHCY